MKSTSQKLVLSLTASILAAGGASAYELSLSTNMPSVDFHGFLSQGYLLSSDYNYLGDTTDGGSFKFTEAGLNASFSPFPRTRISAQGFTYCVGNCGEYDFMLDYAQIEYTFNDYIGIRAGRIRRPEGIYNHIQDVDLARTWVLLPQGMYNPRWRDMYLGNDGGELFGTIPLSKAGSLSYEIYAGWCNPELNGGLSRELEGGGNRMNWIKSNFQVGGQLWWNTPLDGLRFGAALNRPVDSHFQMYVPAPGPGTLNQTANTFSQHYSAEYLWKSWTFQAEYYTFRGNVNSVLIDVPGQPSASSYKQPDSWYISAAYRFNKWVEAGAYYSEYYADVHNRDGADYAAAYASQGAVASDACQRDLALSLRLDPTPWWIFKVEGHYINGTGQIYDNVSNPVRHNNGWFMLALKTTFSF